MAITTQYRRLLTKYAPQPIRSQQDYNRALAQLEELMTPQPEMAESMLIEVLSTLVEAYESRELPLPKVTPAAMLQHLLAERAVRPAELARQTRIPPATISNVLAGRRNISRQNAVRLGDYFGVSPVAFLAVGR